MASPKMKKVKCFGNATIDCTGDVCAGDVVMFTEAVFGGSFRKPVFEGDRRILAEVLRDSYGVAKQQHTFTLKVLKSDGEDFLEKGSVVRRKGRNLYRNGTKRIEWADENARQSVLEEKHNRGRAARGVRAARRSEIEENRSCFGI